MLLVNGIVFDGHSFRENLDVRIRDGAVAEIREGLKPEAGEEVADLGGDYLLPGFVDVHIHGFRGQDTMAGEAAVRHMSRELYRAGVACFCPTTMSASEADTREAVRGIRAVMRSPEARGARAAGAHLEAPFLSENRAGAQKKEFFLDPDEAWLDRVTDGDPSAIRLITLAPERAGSEAFIRKAAADGIRISIGHSDADAETVHRAADWGADHVTHLFNAQTPLHHRKPGVPGAALADDRLYCEMICDGVHLHRDVIRTVVRCKGAEKAIAITDAMEAAGMPEGEYALGGQKVSVRGNECRLEDGTIAGSVLTMPRALENLIHLFGIDPQTACVMCTSAPAASIGEEKAGRMLPGSPVPLTRWSREWRMKEVIG